MHIIFIKMKSVLFIVEHVVYDVTKPVCNTIHFLGFRIQVHYFLAHAKILTM